jgi:hypothetical protein
VQLFTTAKIVRGNVNRTAMPSSAFIELTEIASVSLNKPIEIYGESTGTLNEHTRIDVQIDFYGWELSEVAKAVHASFRTIWAVDRFPSNIAPLYCSDLLKMPIINAEQQHEQRWTMTASMQYNPDVVVPQDSFDTPGDIGVIPADVFYS